MTYNILEAYKQQQKEKDKKKKYRLTCFDCKTGYSFDSCGNAVPDGRAYCKFQKTVVLMGTARSCPFFKKDKRRKHYEV